MAEARRRRGGRSAAGRGRRPAGRATDRSANPDRVGFLPEILDRTVIAIPLLRKFDGAPPERVFDVIVDLNLEFRDGLDGARQRVIALLQQVAGRRARRARQGLRGTTAEGQYVFASLDAAGVKELVRLDGGSGAERKDRAIFHVWPDFELKPLINRSISTVKADAAHNAFAAWGADVVWAVVDSGVDQAHPHFQKHANLELPAPLVHRDFTADGGGAPLEDAYGHGTHVAGIIAGEVGAGEAPIVATTRHRDENGRPTEVTRPLDAISGMAPRCKILSLKVLDGDGRGNGTGRSSSIIAALQYVQKLNGHGRRILVHGVNLSVGYDFEPEWFACGQSPLCVEVDRLVRSGVVVVVAAGNSGYGFAQTEDETVTAGLDLTINDPGNADMAITVGSTHRDMPHVYGVSYFSSKGPTGDGRMKPDLLAPGEKIVSCTSGQMADASGAPRSRSRTGRRREARYREDSGTSMAAPHVSGVIAAFLSIRREYIGRPEEVKRIFLTTATDLQRVPYFQGRGLVDLMRAIQSV